MRYRLGRNFYYKDFRLTSELRDAGWVKLNTHSS